MKFFLDTANLNEIREGVSLGLVDGVTTNPSLVAKEGGVDFNQHVAAICELVAGDVSAEVTSLDTEGMLREGREYAAIAPNVVVKCPLTTDGLKATRQLTSEGIKVNVTLCFSAAQAILAAKAGAAYISPFIGRLDDIGQNGLELVRDIVEIYNNYNWTTEVLAASIRHPIHVIETARLGADVATMPFKVMQQLIKHPLTDKGLDQFLADWRKSVDQSRTKTSISRRRSLMSDSNHHANALVKNTTRKGNASNDRIGKLMLLIKVLVLAVSLTIAVGYFSNRSRAQQNDDRSRGQNQKEYDQQISDNAQRMMEQGKQIFRYDTFGSEDFWGGKLRLHEAIAGQKLGGVGNGVSPKTALALGLKVDAEALPADLVAQIKAGKVDLDDPATTVALLKLKAVVGVTGFFNTTGQLRSLGIQCALCHSTVDDSFAPGIGKRLDGWGNRDLNIGAIVATAPNLQPFSDLLSVDVATVKAVLNSWGPGRYDAELNMDGKTKSPDGKSAATMMPSAFGLAGVNQHTWTGGWGTVTYWNAYVANTQMYGQGTFFDQRLDNAEQYPVAAKAGWGHKRDAKDLITAKLPALHFYQLAMPAPKAPAGSYDAAAAQRGEALFNSKAKCAACHVPPIFTEPGNNLHKAEDIGIDSFQANRGPARMYVTTPLRALFDTQKIHKGGFYHDGRFATLLDVVNHYNNFKKLGLTEQEKKDLVEYLKAL